MYYYLFGTAFGTENGGCIVWSSGQYQRYRGAFDMDVGVHNVAWDCVIWALIPCTESGDIPRLLESNGLVKYFMQSCSRHKTNKRRRKSNPSTT